MKFVQQAISAVSACPSAPARLVRLFGGVLLLLATWLLYSGNSGAPLVFDDRDFFSASYVATFGSAFQPALPRFWPYATFAHQNLLFGQTPEEMRAFNFMLHGLCLLALQAWIAALLATIHASRHGETRPGTREELVALCATGLFAVHPAAVYAVAYLVQRSMLMGTLFSLLMWLCYLKALEGRGKRWLGLSIVCYYFAAFSKEHAVLAPLVPAALTFMFWRGSEAARASQPGLPMLAAAFAAYTLIALGVVLPAARLLGTGYEPLLSYFPEGPDWHQRVWLLERMHWMSILTQCGLFFKYLALWLWPDVSRMSIDMREPLLSDLAVPGNWLGLVAWLCFGALAARLAWQGRNPGRRRVGLFGFGLLTVWGLFIVELMTVRWQEIFVLYRSYLWMTGLTLALAMSIDAVVARRRSNGLLLACLPLVLVLAQGAHDRLHTFSSEILVWDDAVRLIEQRAAQQGNVVGDERAYNNRGVAYAREKKYQIALTDYAKAISLNPNYEAFYQSRGIAQSALGQYAEALESFEKALAVRPSYMSALVNHGLTLERMGRKPEALAEFKQACDAGEIWGCIVHHRRTKPDEEYVFRPRGGAN